MFRGSLSKGSYCLGFGSLLVLLSAVGQGLTSVAGLGKTGELENAKSPKKV